MPISSWVKNHPALKVLSFRNYRFFFIGQGTSLIGTWMQQVAMGWLVYRLTGSALSLGAIAFTSNIPSFFLNPFAGVMVDRWNLRRLLVVTQCVLMAQAFLLWTLVATGTIQAWHLYPLSLLLGVANAFDIPGRQSFVVHMIEDRRYLGNAIAMNSSLFNFARLFGPSLAGLVIAASGESICFLLNALSYLAAVGALVAMRLPTQEIQAETTDVWSGLRTGFHYVWNFRSVRNQLLLLFAAGLLGMPYMVLLPVFAREVLSGDARTLGFLTTATGLGALAGALVLVQRRGTQGLNRFIPGGLGLLGLGIAAFAGSKSLTFSLALLVVASFGNMIGLAACNTLIQAQVEDRYRGRAMSFFSMSLVGMAPFGGLLFGWLAEHVGAPLTLELGGAGTVLASALFWWKGAED
jgi:MFS family permease